MKQRLAFFFALALGLSANASTGVFKFNGQGGNNLAPIRQAKGKLGVYRVAYAKNGTRPVGSVVQVCQKDISIDVFDYRGNDDKNVVVNATTCLSDVFGQPVQISVSPLIRISKDSVFPTEPEQDMKYFIATLEVTSIQPGHSPDIPFAQDYSMTKNLSESSGFVTLSPSMANCKPNQQGQIECAGTYPVVFTALIEFID